jgi:glycosyltransferase involved in cell wall biosynthesis
MTDNQLLSVIIPVYNVKKFLNRCVDSVLNQTYPNLEVIIINDGSSDGSELICASYSTKYNITVINQKNAGQAIARNVGLKIAKGYYIAFLDSDDYIEPDMYQELIKIIKEENIDIAACSSLYEDESSNVLIKEKHTYNKKFINKYDLIGDMYGNRNARSELWNKVFKKTAIGNTAFKSGQKYEEVYFNREVFLNSNGCVFYDKPMHHYVLYRSGNTNSSFSEKKLCIFSELDEIKKILIVNGELKNANKISAMKLFFAMLLNMQSIKFNTSKDTKKYLKDKFREIKKENNGNQESHNLRLRVLLFCVSPKLLMLSLILKKGSIDL